jgi:hypothetical protein
MKHHAFTFALPALVCGCLVPNPALRGDGDTGDTGAPSSTTGGHETDAPDPDEGSTSDDADETRGDADETRGDAEETTGDAEETTGDAAETTGVATCTGSDLQCVPAAPAGWHGPVARLDPEAPEDASCSGAYPQSVASGVTNITAPGASCDCTCTAPSGGACSPTLDVGLYDASCGASCNLNYGSCANLTTTLHDLGSETYVDDDSQGVRLLPSTPNVIQNPSCDPISTHVIPALQATSVEVCAPEAALDETCGAGEICVATPSAPLASPSCIWAEGDLACPAGDYSEREVVHRGIEDTRSCSECSCGWAEDVACEGEIGVSRFWNGHIELPTMYPADGDCSDRLEPDQGVAIGGDVTFEVTYEPEDPSSSGCPASGGVASGSATGIDPITLCCVAP